MQIPKMVWEKEKVLMPDGRYLLYFNFNPISKDQVLPQAKSIQIKKSERN